MHPEAILRHRRRVGANGPSSLTIGIDGRFLQDKFHGIGRYTFDLLAGLHAVKGDHKIILFTDPSLKNSRFPIDALAVTDKLVLRPIAIPLYSVRELWAWPTELHRTPVDVFHSPYFWSPLILPCPLVTTFHDMIFDRYPEYTPGRRFLASYKLFSRLSLRRSERVIAVSEATRRDILRFTGVDQRHVVTVLSGVNAATHFAPGITEEDCARVRMKYDLPASYVLAVGARRPHKNIDRLASAFETIASEVPHSLVLVGTIDERFADRVSDAIVSLKRAGRVREIAHVDEVDMFGLYSGADLLVQPSIIEGFGLPVLEAMACGCPVACSNTSSLPEVAGEAAEYFDPWRETDIASVIRRVLASAELRQGLRERGFARARLLDSRTAANKTLDVYHAAAGYAG